MSRITRPLCIKKAINPTLEKQINSTPTIGKNQSFKISFMISKTNNHNKNKNKIQKFWSLDKMTQLPINRWKIINTWVNSLKIWTLSMSRIRKYSKWTLLKEKVLSFHKRYNLKNFRWINLEWNRDKIFRDSVYRNNWWMIIL